MLLVFVDFFLVGLVISYLTKYFAERFLRKPDKKQLHASSHPALVEPMYTFDIHCNAFFPMFLVLYVLQVVLRRHHPPRLSQRHRRRT